MGDEFTSIPVKEETRDRIKMEKRAGISYDELLIDMVEKYGGYDNGR